MNKNGFGREGLIVNCQLSMKNAPLPLRIRDKGALTSAVPLLFRPFTGTRMRDNGRSRRSLGESFGARLRGDTVLLLPAASHLPAALCRRWANPRVPFIALYIGSQLPWQGSLPSSRRLRSSTVYCGGLRASRPTVMRPLRIICWWDRSSGRTAGSGWQTCWWWCRCWWDAWARPWERYPRWNRS